MIHVIAIITAKPGRRDEVLGHFRANVPAVRAEAGCIEYGAAVDAASRGYSTLLLEQGDFAQGTSSRSTKLIHGGVRYLRQGHIGLVKEALHERGVLRRLAPHLVRDLAFVVPVYDWWEGPFYGLGFKLYDALAGDLGLGPSRNLSRRDCLSSIARKGSAPPGIARNQQGSSTCTARLASSSRVFAA